MVKKAWLSGIGGLAVAIAVLLLGESAQAIQKETPSEKAENLEKQVKGGLFNFWNFDGQQTGGIPAGFAAVTHGDGPAAVWKVDGVAAAPSLPNAVSGASSCDGCMQLLIAQGLQYEYPDLSVRMRMEEGAGSIGLVFGLKDPANFYAAVADLPSKMLRVIRVMEGKTTILSEAPLKPKPVDWHTLRVQRNTIISKDFIETFFDGQITLSVEDQSLGLGQIGLVVQGPVTAHFDSLNAAPLYSHRPVSPPAAY